ncbi:MAG: PIN domain-containing protein [Cyanobacteria bacterium P01_H01_bin.15]
MSGVLVDTCIWSIALRGSSATQASIVNQLIQLIDENQVKIIGAIRQELLSGYIDKIKYEKLRNKLQYFPNEPILDADYKAAAQYSNFCRSKGVQGSNTDFLICAVATRAEFKIYTTDKDFNYYANICLSDSLETFNSVLSFSQKSLLKISGYSCDHNTIAEPFSLYSISRKTLTNRLQCRTGEIGNDEGRYRKNPQ